ncbi:MAG: hypothetical protein H0W89_08000 [Candidatus Levybacteria bacterium]|nr:hypothetical protein [Candidatus Levybacteria bacterium]
MPFNPFSSEGTSLETGDPVSIAAKQAAKAVAQGTQQQAKAANQSFIDQLYGNVSSSPEALDPTADPLKAATQMQAPPASSSGSSLAPAANPSEQSQLDETRRKLQELQGQHKKNYFESTFGEEAQQKRQQREEEERQMKLQEEEEEQQREEEEKARMSESLQAFQSKGHGKGADQLSAPVAVTQAKTKTEVNRGSSG